MGCSQSASRPVARPDAQPANSAGSQPTTNGNASASASSPVINEADVRVVMTSPNGTEQPASTLPTNVASNAHPPAEVAQEAQQLANAIAAEPATTLIGASAAVVPVRRPSATQLLTVHPGAEAVVHVAKQRPLVVCGPSGVGKGTLLSRLLKEYPHVFAKSVSHTTRPPRAGEVNGVHYHFTTNEELLQQVAVGLFIEHANVHGKLYGTSIASVTTVMDSGKICLLEIDIQGVLSVKKIASLNPISIFLRAPTFQDLIDRLNGRGSENDETMQKRLDTARNEMDFFYTNRHVFEADVINAEFEESYARLLHTIQRLYPNVDLSKPVKQ